MIAVVILAAGTSSRLGRAKQLLQLGDRTVIEHVVDRALASDADRVIVVVGHEAAKLTAALSSRDVAIVENADYAQGQSTSLRAGIRAAADADAAVLLLGDQPGIATADIDGVIAAWRERGSPIVQTRYGKTRSHPTLFASSFFPDLLTITGDEGARSLVRTHIDALGTFESALPDPPLDIDTEEAWNTLRSGWS
jgi:molybdenum cofactor cytidylyltransferase